MSVCGDIYFIEERLREISPLLVVSFSTQKERYVVYEKVTKFREEGTLDDCTLYSTYDEYMHVTTLQNDDGSFRPLDQRLLHELIDMDTHRDENHIKHQLAKARKYRESYDKDVADYNTQVAKYYHPLVRREIRYGL